MNERDLFEDAFKKAHSGIAFCLNTWDDEEKDYGNTIASWSWLMWQASANRQVYKLVPVEPDKDTIIRIASVCIGDDFANIDEAKEIYKAMVGN